MGTGTHSWTDASLVGQYSRQSGSQAPGDGGEVVSSCPPRSALGFDRHSEWIRKARPHANCRTRRVVAVGTFSFFFFQREPSPDSQIFVAFVSHLREGGKEDISLARWKRHSSPFSHQSSGSGSGSGACARSRRKKWIGPFFLLPTLPQCFVLTLALVPQRHAQEAI
jgi:hypothetical protein